MTHPLTPTHAQLIHHFGEHKVQFINTDDPPLLYPMSIVFDHRVQLLCAYKGTRPVPYQIDIQLSFDQQRALALTCACDCPDGVDGRCKHVATVLMAWRNDPSQFVNTPQSHADPLVSTLGHVMPQTRLFWPLPTTDAPVEDHLRAISSRCRTIQQEARLLDLAPTQVARRMLDGLALIAPLAQHQRWAAVVDCLDVWLEALLTHMGHEMFWAPGLNLALDWLEQCLCCQTLTSHLRQRTWQTLLKVVFEVPLQPCVDRAQDMILLHRREQDLTPLTLLVRQHMHGEDHPLLFELEAQTLSMDLFVERALALEQYDALVRHLVEHQQRERLRSLVTSKPTLRFHLIVEACLRAGVADWVVDWVEIGFKSHNTVRLAHWLEQAYADSPERALPMAQFRLHQQPTHETLASVRRLARQLGQWSALRPNTVQWLSTQQQHVLLLRVHTLDAQWDAVWTAIDRAKQDGLHHRLSWLQESARTVGPLSDHHPERALVLCSESLHALLTHHPEAGRAQIAELREQKKRLQAMLGAS